MDYQNVFEELKEKFPDSVLELDMENSIPPKIKIASKGLKAVCEYLSGTYKIPFDSLMCLSGEDVGEELGVVLHLYSMKDKETLALESLCSREEPHIDSVASVYHTADWHEREAYDMFGILFDGHPNMKRMFLADDWEGYPLRKDYVPADSWHGMSIAKELTQKMK